jgi:putative DNA primase/helicase
MLGVPGGAIDLRSAKLCPPDYAQYITKRCAVAPDHGKPVRWLEYLKRCHSGNDEVIAYLRRFSGYCCTGATSEHALAFLYGTGRNGKGVFLETISRILGDYARTAPMATFLEQKNPAHSTELARLHKARLVITEESGAGGKWNESRIKHLTGGGKITARFMREDDFEFIPNFKLLIASNHKPSIRSVDEAMKARLHMVPFNITIPADERDPNLLEKLEEEWPQILGWMLDGCAEWQQHGLTPPDEVKAATERYMESEDILGDWINANCVMEGECDASDAFKNYGRWCDEQGHSPWSRIGWSRALLERGTVDSRKSNGRTYLIGLSLKPSQF